MAVYAQFIDQQNKQVPDGEPLPSWPPFNTRNYDRLFTPPKKDKLGNLFDACFDLVFPYMERDLYNRSPGQSVSWDGTFDYARKTKDDEFAEEEINVLCILFGWLGHILSFAFAESEGSQVYQQLNYFLKKWCDRLGSVMKSSLL